MKKIYLFLYFSFCILNSAFSQGGTWTWINGDSTINSPGVFGIKGIPDIINHPPGMYEPCEWKDKQGNFWLYGGSYNTPDCILWKYNPVTNEWTWVQGDGGSNELPVYGMRGVAGIFNTPGSKIFCAATWVDTSGNFWLFGGGEGTLGTKFKNDLWKYDLSTNEWTWMKGDSITDAGGVHGILGVPGPLNTPGARDETCSAWTDSLNNLWLFGGQGFGDSSSAGYLNDLCKYDISTNEWTWMKGSALSNAAANYGTEGVPDINNDPGGRLSYTKWKDKAGNFWLMGGDAAARFNDVWKYNYGVNEWTWMSGTATGDDAGNYNTTCIFDSMNLPYSRMEQRSSVTDNCGNFWLFGGWAASGYFNDLWVFDPQQLKWNWLSGSNIPSQTGDYGNKGVPSSSNVPPSRFGTAAWWGNDNRFYIFGGFYTYSDVWVFTPDTNCVHLCNSVTILPPVTGFQSNKTNLCANDCINFTDLSSDAISWDWSFAGGSPAASTDQNPQVCYLDSGIYNVTLIASNAGGSDTLSMNNYITVHAAPVPPVIKQINDTLLNFTTDSGYKSYQWYFDSTLVAGATDTFLVISKSGNYNVAVTNDNGCKTSVGINVVIGLQNYMSDHILSLWPNPATNELRINNVELKIANIAIYDMLGRNIHSEQETRNEKQETILDVSMLSPGIYFVQLTPLDKYSTGLTGEKERPGVSFVERWVGRFVKK